jgi:hypothetical protein
LQYYKFAKIALKVVVEFLKIGYPKKKVQMNHCNTTKKTINKVMWNSCNYIQPNGKMQWIHQGAQIYKEKIKIHEWMWERREIK